MKLTTYRTKFWLYFNKVVVCILSSLVFQIRKYFCRLRIRASVILNYGPDPNADELWIRAPSGPDLEICVAIEKFFVK